MAESLSCTRATISAAPDACSFVREYCEDQYEYINFLNFYYCDINQSVPLIALLSIIFILVISNLLGTTAEKYLAPALEILASKLKMSEAIAGATLLALANGADDVVAGLVAGSKDSGGVQIAIGALFGACLFTVTCVLARCLQGAGSIEADSQTLTRDIMFLLVAAAYFILLAAINAITPLLAAGFFLIYLLYLGFVIYQEIKHRRARKASASSQDTLLDEEVPESKEARAKAKIKKMIRLVTRRSARRLLSMCHRDSPEFFNEEDGRVDWTEDKQIEHENNNEISPKDQGEDEEECSRFRKFMEMYNKPFLFLRDLTMLPCQAERWSLYKATLAPFLGSLFVIWQFGLVDTFNHRWYLWTGYAIIASAVSAWIFIQGQHRNLAEVYPGKFSFITFFVSALWLTFFANCFMDFLHLITIISGLPLNYLSLTLLAWGNSLDDFFIDYFIAKSGHGAMAITGVYAGQLFNLLIGFGGSMFLQSLKKTVRPDIFSFDQGNTLANVLTLTLLGSLAMCLIATLLFTKVNHWIMSKKMMIFVLGFYLSFFVVVTILMFAL